MTLTDEQKTQVAAWISEGAKPADVQTRLEKEFGVRVTYMDVRFLIDDLKVAMKDPEPEPPPVEPAAPSPLAAPDAPGGGAGKVRVVVDEITRPGAVVSGKVTFSDGINAAWYLDQYGRLGLVADDPAYRPSQSDAAEFQMALEQELQKLGM